MKLKKIILSALVLCVFCFFSLYVNADENELQNSKVTIESSGTGCINRPGENDGHCVTDGNEYLCANRHFLQHKDCVKGEYPE